MGLNIPPDLGQPNQPPGQGEHEFDIMQNSVIGGLAGWMLFVGIILIIFGSVQCLFGMLALPAGLLTLGQGVCMLLIGVWTCGASRSFKQIVTTEGADITLLMDALKKLRAVYTLQGILLIIALALLVVVVFLFFSARPSHM